jgi:hypothetical protein
MGRSKEIMAQVKKNVKVEKFDNGIRVINPTAKVLDMIMEGFGNGKDWKFQKDGSAVLFGLFGVVDIILGEIASGELKI